MTYEFHAEALAEYEEAARHYAEQEGGLEIRFINAVEDAIERIVDHPHQWRLIYPEVRRCLTRVFPYGVVYTLEDEYVLIVAVAHCSRRPYYWEGRTA